MTSAFARRLRDLAAQDPAVAPLALLQAEALDAASDPTWRDAVPTFASAPPLLDGATIHLDPDRLRELFHRLGAEVAEPLPLLEASITQDAERLSSLGGGSKGAQRTPRSDEHTGRQAAPVARNASGAPARTKVAEGAESETPAGSALAVITQVASLPLLLACGAEAAPRLKDLVWEHGFCPVCAAWPTLLEVRGLERQRWLRCGRCGSGWSQINALCAFCGCDEYRSQAYLAPEAERESRQALTCQKCRGYLKAFTTLGPLDPGELLLRDLLSLELDVAALDQGYARPEEPATRHGFQT